jgi:predicted metalloprotease
VFKHADNITFTSLEITALNSHREIAKARVRTQGSPCVICSRQSDTGTGFSPSPSFSPVNIIPLLLHIHSCIIWGVDNGPVSGRNFHRDTISPHSSNNKNKRALNSEEFGKTETLQQFMECSRPSIDTIWSIVYFKSARMFRDVNLLFLGYMFWWSKLM